MRHDRIPGDLVGDERWARLLICHIVEPGCPKTVASVRAWGASRTAAALLSGDLVPTGGREPVVERVGRIDLPAAIHSLESTGVRLVVPSDAEWPSGLGALRDPPYALFVKGAPLGELTERSLAIVGARASTDYGNQVAFELAEGVAGRGLTVVSGAAYGIDAAAHRGALAAEGPTVAVLACGLDRAYPSAHRGLLDRICAAGALAGEIPIGWAPLRWRFLARNRLIATMTAGTVVVEAGLRSGSQSTATHAFTAQRFVLAVPGPVTAATSAGCHEMIRTGKAAIVTDLRELFDVLGKHGVDAVGPRRAPESPEAELAPAPYAVWSALSPHRWTLPDRLVERAGVGLRVLLPALRELQEVGLADEDDAGRGWRKVVPWTAASEARGAESADAG